MLPTDKQIQTIARHFIIAAIWAECPEGTHPRATKQAVEAATVYVRHFLDMIGPALFEQAMECKREGYGAHPDAGSPEAAFGHDLWLSSGGHGVGFCDRDPLDVPPLGMCSMLPHTVAAPGLSGFSSVGMHRSIGVGCTLTGVQRRRTLST